MPRKLELSDIAASKYGRWTILKYAIPVRSGKRTVRYVLARCDCGKESVVNLSTIRNGRSKSCGCLRRELITSHGLYLTQLYRACSGMKCRCTNPQSDGFDRYGGRGIRFNFPSLSEAAIWIDGNLGPRPSSLHSIDRINNDGHYEPGNLRWATRKTQQNNRQQYRTKLSQFSMSELLGELDKRSLTAMS